MPTPVAQSIALAAYGLSEQLWGMQPKKIEAGEFIDEIARMVDEALTQQDKETATNVCRTLTAAR